MVNDVRVERGGNWLKGLGNHRSWTELAFNGAPYLDSQRHLTAPNPPTTPPPSSPMLACDSYAPPIPCCLTDHSTWQAVIDSIQLSYCYASPTPYIGGITTTTTWHLFSFLVCGPRETHQWDRCPSHDPFVSTPNELHFCLPTSAANSSVTRVVTYVRSFEPLPTSLKHIASRHV